MSGNHRNHATTAFQYSRPACQSFSRGLRDQDSDKEFAPGFEPADHDSTEEEQAGSPLLAARILAMFVQRALHFSSSPMQAENVAVAGARTEAAGLQIVRYAVVLVLVWIGAMKFTAYEAAAIQPLVASSPFMAWLYQVLSVQAVSNLIGVAEITAGVLIALRPWSAKACVVGSLMAVATFVTTLTFLFSTPGWEASLGGFPALSVAPGQFILKDAVLLGAAVWSFGEAVRHSTASS